LGRSAHAARPVGTSAADFVPDSADMTLESAL